MDKYASIVPEPYFASHSVISVVTGAGILVLVFMLVQASRLWYRPRFALPLLLGAVLAVLGLLFKIEHWAGINGLLTGGALTIAGSYGSWFAIKATKMLLSYLKLALVLSISSYFLALAWWPAGMPLTEGVGRLFFWAVALLYVYQRWVRRPASEVSE